MFEKFKRNARTQDFRHSPHFLPIIYFQRTVLRWATIFFHTRTLRSSKYSVTEFETMYFCTFPLVIVAAILKFSRLHLYNSDFSFVSRLSLFWYYLAMTKPIKTLLFQRFSPYVCLNWAAYCTFSAVQLMKIFILRLRFSLKTASIRSFFRKLLVKATPHCSMPFSTFNYH